MRQAIFLLPEPFQWVPESPHAYLDNAGIAMQMLSNLPKQLFALKA